MAVNSIISPVAVPQSTMTTGGLQENNNKTKSFAEYLRQTMEKADELEVQANRAAEEFAAGKTDDIDQVMIAAAKADLALQFAIQIRTKILDAYNEIMRMQI